MTRVSPTNLAEHAYRQLLDLGPRHALPARRPVGMIPDAASKTPAIPASRFPSAWMAVLAVRNDRDVTLEQSLGAVVRKGRSAG